ncbi:hypothetical protein [Nonomuraea sp. NPDC003709]|uniref:hypothetical protein n=1 Tax=Nonomuraea sp. NPDC003709 TaxID=3154450 RepID=UPI0033BB99F6
MPGRVRVAPDLLNDHLIVTELRHEPALRPALLHGLSDGRAGWALQTLARAAHTYPEAADWFAASWTNIPAWSPSRR